MATTARPRFWMACMLGEEGREGRVKGGRGGEGEGRMKRGEGRVKGE